MRGAIGDTSQFDDCRSPTALRGYNLRKVVRETAIEQNECMTRVRHEGAVDPKWATF